MRYEILDGPNGAVINTIRASESFVSENYQHYRVAANQDPAPALPMQITRFAFLNRFTQAERLDIRTAAKSSVALEDFLALVNSAQFIDLQRTDTQSGVQFLESEGLIAAGRADEILTTAPNPSERPD